ncbi:MAG: HAD family hydrolase [Candidatus Hodarchaeota archaeon]
MVFDVSGTLLEPAVVIRDIHSGRMAENIELNSGKQISGFDFLSSNPQYALAALDIDPGVISDEINHYQKISTFIKENEISIYSLYSEGDLSEEEILAAILSDNTVTIHDYKEAINTLKNTHEIEWLLTLMILVDVLAKKMPYIGVVGGKTFPKVQDLIKILKDMEISIYLASGEQRNSLERVGEHIGVEKDFIYSNANAGQKGEIIESLKREFDFVIMVGNSLNDIMAMKKAQIAILNKQYSGLKTDKRLLEVSDFTVAAIEELILLIPKIVTRLAHSNRKMKEVTE